MSRSTLPTFFRARAIGDARAPEQVAVCAERMGAHLSAGLGRWIGGPGYRALLGRALGVARTDHPALGGVSLAGGNEQTIVDAIRIHGIDEFAAGFVSLLATLIDLLGRIIGEDMAARLVVQIGVPSPREGRSTGTVGAHDD